MTTMVMTTALIIIRRPLGRQACAFPSIALCVRRPLGLHACAFPSIALRLTEKARELYGAPFGVDTPSRDCPNYRPTIAPRLPDH